MLLETGKKKRLRALKMEFLKQKKKEKKYSLARLDRRLINLPKKSLPQVLT